MQQQQIMSIEWRSFAFRHSHRMSSIHKNVITGNGNDNIDHESASECVGFNITADVKQVILEMSLSRQLTALLLTTKNKETKHHIHPKHKGETEKATLANQTIYTLIWYAFYDLRSGNGPSPILTVPEPTQDYIPCETKPGSLTTPWMPVSTETRWQHT